MTDHRAGARFAAGFVMLFAVGAASGQTYTIIDLVTLPGGAFSGAAAINNRGQVAGASDTSTADEIGRRAFIRTGGVLIDLGLADVPFALSSEAVAINALGQTVFNVS